ncbi:hypothetical protein ACLJK8_23170, partial [Amaricoccus sp. W119]
SEVSALEAPPCSFSPISTPPSAQIKPSGMSQETLGRRTPRFTPDPDAGPTEDLRFLPVEIVEPSGRDDARAPVDAGDPVGTIEIELVGGHRMRINGGYDPEALARLIRGLSG